MNPGSTDAPVSIKAYATDGSVLGQNQSFMIVPANGNLTFDNILNALGASGYGPLEITSVNNLPLIATSRVAGLSGAGGFFEGLAVDQVATSQIIPYLVENATTRTNLGINNVSNAAATVTAHFINKNGSELGTYTATVPSKGLTQLNSDKIVGLLSSVVGGDVECYVRLESTQPFFGWVSQIENVTSDPGFSVSKSLGASHLLIQSAVNTPTWQSSLVIVNTSSLDAFVDIISRSNTGEIQSQMLGVLVPGRGFYSNENVLSLLGITNSFGPLEINASSGQQLLATSRVRSTSQTSGFFEGQPIE
jgi:hypothetical protein